MNFDSERLLLYAITDGDREAKRSVYERTEDALRGGVTMVQLREKDLQDDLLVEEATRMCSLCHEYGVPLIINDRLDVALRSGADGVHVGAGDMDVAEIRKKVPENFIIGATAKTVEQARRAEDAGADYLGVGAVFPSPTKANAVCITPDQLKDIEGAVSIPCVAIGGITLDNADVLRGSDIAGIAVVSAVYGAENITEACIKLKEKARSVRGGRL